MIKGKLKVLGFVLGIFGVLVLIISIINYLYK